MLGFLLILLVVTAGVDGGRPAVASAAPHAPGELLFALSDGAADPVGVAASVGMRLQLLEEAGASGIFRARVDGIAPVAAARRLAAHTAVRFAEPNYELRVAQAPAAFTPNDPRYPEQQWFWELIGAPQAWAISQGDRAIVVALLDGAVDLDHPDIAANVWTNDGEIAGNGVDDDGNGYVDDLHGYDFVGAFAGTGDPLGEDSDPDVAVGDPSAGDGIDQDGDGMPDGAVGHGTSVAGLLAAVGNDATGVAGVAWQVSVMPVRVTGPEGDGFFSSFVKAMDYAVANDADIINISLASSVITEAAQTAVQSALDAGIVVIGAAGNTGFNVSFPAGLDGVIAVGAHGGEGSPDTRASFSPRSPGVDIVAPGNGLLTTHVTPVSVEPAYTTVVGTSFSAPLVSGAAALVLALRPEASADEVRALLLANAVDLPDGADQDWDGAGRLDLGVLAAAAQLPSPFAPSIDTVRAEDGALRVAGTAQPGSTILLQDLNAELEFGSIVAQIDGSFAFEYSLNLLPEQLATLDITATATSPQGVSEVVATSVVLPYEITLVPGWNLVPWVAVDASGEEAFASLPPEVTRVFRWRGGSWDVGLRGNSLLQLDAALTGDGLWVWLDSEGPALWRQRRAPFSGVTLRNGWNLVAWGGPSGSPDAAAAASSALVQAIFRWDAVNGTYSGFAAATPRSNGLSMIGHLDPLWVLVAGAGANWPGDVEAAAVNLTGFASGR